MGVSKAIEFLSITLLFVLFLQSNFIGLRSQFATLNNASESLTSQNVILKKGRGQHSKYLPYAFTRNGVAMLSSVLRSETAVGVNIRIMRAHHR